MREDKIGLERGTNISARYTMCSLRTEFFFLVWIFFFAYFEGSEEFMHSQNGAVRFEIWGMGFCVGCCFLSLFCVLVLLGGVSEDCRFSTPPQKRAHGYSYLCMVAH